MAKRLGSSSLRYHSIHLSCLVLSCQYYNNDYNYSILCFAQIKRKLLSREDAALIKLTSGSASLISDNCSPKLAIQPPLRNAIFSQPAASRSPAPDNWSSRQQMSAIIEPN